jgi:hypothetical protein
MCCTYTLAINELNSDVDINSFISNTNDIHFVLALTRQITLFVDLASKRLETCVHSLLLHSTRNGITLTCILTTWAINHSYLGPPTDYHSLLEDMQVHRIVMPSIWQYFSDHVMLLAQLRKINSYYYN